MKNILIVCLLLTAGAAGAQTFFPMRKGAVLEYKYYDAKGKPLRDEWKNERWLRFTVDEVWGDSVANVLIDNENLARSAATNEPMKRTVSEMSYGDICITEKGVIFENMWWIFPQIPNIFNYYFIEPAGIRNGDTFCSDGESYYHVELSATSFLPYELQVGDKLPDERYSALFVEELSEQHRKMRKELSESYAQTTGDKLPLTFNIQDRASIIDRRVEAFEKVSVPAGDFDCWKISYESVKPETKILGLPEGVNTIVTNPMAFKYIDYFSPDLGLVKREKLNFRGNKAEEVMILESIK